MPTVLEQLPTGSVVSLIRLRSMGDCILTTPALHLLKRERPDLRAIVVAEKPFRAVFEQNPDVADILEPSVKAIRQATPALCLNLHGGTRSTVLTMASGARFRAGFGHYRYQHVYNVVIPTAQQILGEERKVHTAEHVASAMFHLGVHLQEIPRARIYADSAPSAKPYAVIHPFASAADKTWPAESFRQAAAHLAATGLEPVFIGTTTDNLAQFEPFRTASLPLRGTMSLLAGAALFVGNDSGPAHMAAAFGLPVVVLFSASDPVIWAPWKTRAESILAPEGIHMVPASRVIEAMERLRLPR